MGRKKGPNTKRRDLILGAADSQRVQFLERLVISCPRGGGTYVPHDKVTMAGFGMHAVRGYGSEGSDAARLLREAEERGGWRRVERRSSGRGRRR